MREGILNPVEILVNIRWHPETRRYIWTYEGEGVDPTTGNLKLKNGGRTSITYKLDDDCTESYQLLYVNLDPGNCATSQIEQVDMHHEENSITIIDRNEFGNTGMTPFSLRLVARMRDKIASGFLSPDPQVTNSPNIPCMSQ